jgi:hypothetical protein
VVVGLGVVLLALGGVLVWGRTGTGGDALTTAGVLLRVADGAVAVLALVLRGTRRSGRATQ